MWLGQQAVDASTCTGGMDELAIQFNCDAPYPMRCFSAAEGDRLRGSKVASCRNFETGK